MNAKAAVLESAPQKIAREFDMFCKIYQSLISTYGALPIDDNVKFVTLGNLDKEFFFTQKVVELAVIRAMKEQEDATRKPAAPPSKKPKGKVKEKKPRKRAATAA